MTIAEKLLPLYEEKVKLYEKNLLEVARLVKKYHWRAKDPDDLLKIDHLSEELDKVQEKIDNIIQHDKG